MNIVMHSCGIPFNGDTIKNSSLGGSESAAYYVAKELAERGHRVVLFTDSTEGGIFDGVIYLHAGERSNEQPLGVNWHFYCENTPHDVNIAQRAPMAFIRPIQSKINLWWAHDIALRRNSNANMCQTWQTNRILPVSKWFGQQIRETWNVNPRIITPIHNGVDYSLFEKFELKDNSTIHEPLSSVPITLLYSSRPERGLEHLVTQDGIMEQLLSKAPHVKLKVCGYEHPVSHLDGFYTLLRDRIDELPNCEHIGALSKEELAKIMCTEADVWCYPTEFEEVSCITAMEVMAAGMSIVTTNVGALPETIGNYENAAIFNVGADGLDRSKFVDWLVRFDNRFRRLPSREYTWDKVADEIEFIIHDEFEQANCETMYPGRADAVARHFLRHSDITAIDYLTSMYGTKCIDEEVLGQLRNYDFRNDQAVYAKHYADGTEEMYDGPGFRYESEGFANHPRYLQVGQSVSALPEGSVVVDYGCAHGHFTNFLARDFPEIQFLGIDVSPKAIKVAEAKANEWNLENVEYVVDDWLAWDGKTESPYCDAIILGEILEHVPDPVEFIETVHSIVGNVKVIMTTPFGPWEQMSYENDDSKRFHLHHFDRTDLEELFGQNEGFRVDCLPGGCNSYGELLGWYVTTFAMTASEEPVGQINYERKINETVPRQTVSFCMIVRNGEHSIKKLLDSVQPYVDEVIIGIDETTSDDTESIAVSYSVKNRAPALRVEVINIPSPLEIGFDAARNITLRKATKQWILWADHDEELVSGERIPKFLRNNGWDGYGLAQHHFSVEPLGVLSTDFPVRLLRRKSNVGFRGVVHEHPEQLNLQNEGIGHAWVVNDIHFAHTGYTTEPIRRARFARNLSLMARDREENPERILGRFLWIRDLALMCRFNFEKIKQVTPDMRRDALTGVKLWEDTIDKYSTHPQTVRMVRDHLEFYSTLVNVLDRGFEFSMKMSSGLLGQRPPIESTKELSARFYNRRHLDKFLSIVIDNEVKDYEAKYL